ncbi:MAG: NUDIX hydrolase [Muribaculaceae bacterium]
MSTNKETTYCYRYPRPCVTVDCVIFGYDLAKLSVLLVQRANEPYQGLWALPGGFLEMTEDATQGALRELQEETGLQLVDLTQFHTFTAPSRDPRDRVISVAHYALTRLQPVKGNDDAACARWFELDKVPQLAFDHDRILSMAEQALRQQIHFSPIGIELMPEVFTIDELQNLYETILGKSINRQDFYNKIMRLEMLEQIDGTIAPSHEKDNILFRFNKAKYEELKQKGFRLEF